MTRRGALAGIAVGAVCLAAATPAFSGDTDGLLLTVAKSAGGPYGDEPLRFNRDVGESATEWVKVKNRTNDKVRKISFQKEEKAIGLDIKVFHGDENVTGDAESGTGYKFTLDARETTKFRVRAKVTDEEGMGCWLAFVSKQDVGEDSGYGSVNMPCFT